MREVKVNRPTLGPFMSVVCFRYLHDDAEELAGRAVIVDAGRNRGKDLVEELGLEGKGEDPDTIYQELSKALGPDGTRLCLIQSVSLRDNGGYDIHSIECASPTYTFGVLIGAISAITGKQMLGKEIDTTEEGDVDGRIYHLDPL